MNEPGVPLLPIIAVIIGIFIYFFGWIVLVYVLGLALLITAGTYLHDKIWPPKDPYGQAMLESDASIIASQETSLPIKDDKCMLCESDVFIVVPGKVSRVTIIEWAKNSSAWRDNPDACAGDLHPGLYCPNGCFSILIEPEPER